MINQLDLTQQLAQILVQRHWKIALAESCTGGLVSACLTELAGSSEWFERGYVTYSNQAKIDCLGVPNATLERFGAVSEEVSRSMVQGAQKNAGVQVAVAITGIAGPTGGSAEKPVGTVCFGWTIDEKWICKTAHFIGDRQAVREQACDYALSELLTLLQ